MMGMSEIFELAIFPSVFNSKTRFIENHTILKKVAKLRTAVIQQLVAII